MPRHRRRNVVIGFLGTSLDAGKAAKRWERWRPTVSLCQHEELVVDRIELLYSERWSRLTEAVRQDIAQVSPETTVVPRQVEIADPWDFEEVYSSLHDFATKYEFDTDNEDYLAHITTGSHVAQICMFLLTEARYMPARLIQTSPPGRGVDAPGEYRIIDLDLSRYDRLASRFECEHVNAIASLKGGIETRNQAFNQLIERIEHVAVRTTDPMLITGPTGAGKSRLAGRIYELRKHRRLVEGPLVEVNCATLRGDSAMSTLFGHKKGAFTGAASDRAGLLSTANGGMLFLDEIGDLGLDEQAMLLRAVEEGRFLPLGSDKESTSEFQLLAGTNRALTERVSQGLFREDLLARINLWTFELPALRSRTEDIEPNLEFELERFARERSRLVRFSSEARERFLSFACSADAAWPGNFRDLSACLTRMATLAPGGRITMAEVDEEADRLRTAWSAGAAGADASKLMQWLDADAIQSIDEFDRVQLEHVVAVCSRCGSVSEAGRRLFAASRAKRKSVNDADRLRKYLSKFGLSWNQVVDDR